MRLKTLFKKSKAFTHIKNSEVTKRQIAFTDFNTLEVANDINVFVTFSESKQQIVIEANENLQELIRVENLDNKLIIYKKKNLVVKGDETTNVYVHCKPFSKFSAANDCTLTLETELHSQKAKVKLSQDSAFKGIVNVQEFEMQFADDSKGEISGYIEYLNLKLADDSKLKNYELTVGSLDAHLSEDSTAHLTVNKTINVKASSDSKLKYKGNAKLNAKFTSGDSSVKQVK
ncbi:DUF2807 domain-containing protein [Aureisphaera galaxeae]|uniref:head GIN domain-containing protein n=1 Tax=Aureisphaera galaxeae TaxID=1538023 RepID=UPI0023508C40|nr:head GIN domain-containing protein [Aureisphaera galaxeae]MDC8004728.1 DUF2807 domain-containing protein [Aureisphaera galaxeae]